MVSFIETRTFTRLVQKSLSDEDYQALQAALIADPDAGPVIPGLSGVRKLRWAAAGRGKRGGYRVIYYPQVAEGTIWLLTLYAKNVTETIPAHMLKRIREEIEDGKG